MNLLQTILNPSSLKVVDEQTLVTKWPSIAVISVDILSSAVATDIPLAATSLQVVSVYEEGIISNMQAAKVLMPAAMTVNAVISDQSTMDSVIAGWRNTESTYTITSRSIIAKAMALTTVEIGQTNENLSGVTVTLTFEQTSISDESQFNPRQQADKDSLGIDSKQPEGLTSTVTNLYNNIKSKLGI